MLCQICLLQSFTFIFAPSVRPVDLDNLKSWRSVSSSAVQGNMAHSGCICCSYCCSAATASCPALCDPTDCSTPSSPVLRYLPEFAQILMRWFGAAVCVRLATRWSPMALAVSYPHLCALPFTFSVGCSHWLAFNEQKTSQDGASLPCLGYKQTLTSLSGSPSPPFRIISLWEKSATMQRQPCGQGAGDHQQPDMQSWSWVLLELNPERLQALPTPDWGLLTDPMS